MRVVLPPSEEADKLQVRLKEGGICRPCIAAAWIAVQGLPVGLEP